MGGLSGRPRAGAIPYRSGLDLPRSPDCRRRPGGEAAQGYDLGLSCFQGDPGPEGPSGPPGPPGKPVSVLRPPTWQCVAEEGEGCLKHAWDGEGSGAGFTVTHVLSGPPRDHPGPGRQRGFPGERWSWDKANAALGRVIWRRAVVEIGWVWRQDSGIWGGASQSGSASWGGRRFGSWQDGEALPRGPEAGL